MPVADSKIFTENLSPNRQPLSYLPRFYLFRSYPTPTLPYPDPTLTLPWSYPSMTLPRPYPTPVIPNPTPTLPQPKPYRTFYPTIAYLNTQFRIGNWQLVAGCRFKNASPCRQPLSCQTLTQPYLNPILSPTLPPILLFPF